MKTNPITIDTILNAHPTKVWQAITNKNEMQNGYFDLAEFEPVAGFRFTFNGGSSPEKQYTHVCEIIHVESEKKLSYSWWYTGYAGKSVVSFELTPNENQTNLHFTHEGVDNFPK